MLLAMSLLVGEADAGEIGFMCRRQAGVDVGLVYAPGTWDRLGLTPWFVGGGFTAGLGCSADVERFMVWGTAEYTLFYPHYASKDSLQHDWLQVFIGASGGFGPLWVGGHVIGDLRPVGAGAHLLWFWAGDPGSQRQGLEVRLNGYWRVQPNMQLQVLYTVASPNTRRASTDAGHQPP
jgi:hypothetical protein